MSDFQLVAPAEMPVQAARAEMPGQVVAATYTWWAASQQEMLPYPVLWSHTPWELSTDGRC
jgi:hypothetical protein